MRSFDELMDEVRANWSIEAEQVYRAASLVFAKASDNLYVPHDHRENVDGCYRCELSLDEG